MVHKKNPVNHCSVLFNKHPTEFHFCILHLLQFEQEMATHSSILALRIWGTGEPGGLPSMRLYRVGHDWSDLAAAAAAPPSGLSSYVNLSFGWDALSLSLSLSLSHTHMCLHTQSHSLSPFSASFFFKKIFFFYCSGFCHTLKWISHGFTCVPHPDPPSHLPLHPIPLGLPSAPGPSACLVHPTWVGDLFQELLYSTP